MCPQTNVLVCLAIGPFRSTCNVNSEALFRAAGRLLSGREQDRGLMSFGTHGNTEGFFVWRHACLS